MNNKINTDTKNKMAFIQNCIGGILKKNPCIKGNNAKLGQVGGFNTMAPEVQERTEKLVKMIQDRIAAYGLPLQVYAKYLRSKVFKNIVIEPSPAFYELIASTNPDPEYFKIVNYTEKSDRTYDYPKLTNLIELDINDYAKTQITCVKVQVIVNSPIYTIQHSIMVTWLFTEFINRMGLEYFPPENFDPPQEKTWPIWGEPSFYVPDPIHFERGCYKGYWGYFSKDTFDQSIMTIDMAKTSSQNIYAYFPRADDETIFDPTSNRE
jgi:hypothetical protein